MRPDSRTRLEAFVALIEKVEQYPYFSGGERVAGSSLSIVNGQPVMEFFGPPDDQTDAVALRVRLLTHGDDISIRRLGELFDDPGISIEWRESYERWAGALQLKMGQTWAKGSKGTLTIREAFDMELHGHRGHYKAADRAFKTYQRWVTSEFERECLESAFHEVLIFVVAVGHNLALASRREIAGDV